MSLAYKNIIFISVFNEQYLSGISMAQDYRKLLGAEIFSLIAINNLLETCKAFSTI